MMKEGLITVNHRKEGVDCFFFFLVLLLFSPHEPAEGDDEQPVSF